MSAKTDLKHAAALMDLLEAGFGYLDLYCTMSTTVQQFPITTAYNQLQVPSYLEEAR